MTNKTDAIGYQDQYNGTADEYDDYYEYEEDESEEDWEWHH